MLVALISTVLFSIGCSCLLPSPTPYGPRVTGDGTGGAIAVYEDIKGIGKRAFYAQRVSSEGDALWGKKGVLVGSGYKNWDSFFDLHIINDDSGGAIITWLAYPSRQHQTPLVHHVTRVDSEGSILWQREVRGVDHMISDGAGGAIIATDYSYDEETLFILKIDAEGNFPWGPEGVYIRREGYCDHSLGVSGDGNGGAIFIWQERKGEPDNRVSQIFAQKIDADGGLPWGQGGVLLYTTPEGVYSEEPKVISDGSGGAITVWMQVPEGKIEEGSPKALMMDLYVQRVDAGGNIIWQPNGVPLEISKAAEGAFPHSPNLVIDNSGGAIIVWEDGRKGLMSLYAQKLDADGNLRWRPGGVEVCYIKTNSSFWPRMAVSDDSGGVIVTFGTRAQRIDAGGRTMWRGDGIKFADGDTHDLAYDGQGGAITAWGIGKSLFKPERAYVQRIDAEGNRLWGDEGSRLTP